MQRTGSVLVINQILSPLCFSVRRLHTRMTKKRKIESELGSGGTPDKKAKQETSAIREEEEEKSKWEEIKCPVCWEHPHNAVLLRCSSHKKGCRPYMCNTSQRYSNCLNHFIHYQTFYGKPDIVDNVSTSEAKAATSKVKCPMCRGKITGWKVVGPARTSMNSKPRSCSCDGCDFRGNYSELRQHVRSEHPFSRPGDSDPRRVNEWETMVSEMEYEDAFFTFNDTESLLFDALVLVF